MRNILILGSGRSGTSMVTGSLSKAGYFMGENLYPPRGSNPKGFFENSEVNGINETLLEQVLPGRLKIIPERFREKIFRTRPMKGQLWLARVPLGSSFTVTPAIQDRMRALTKKAPYCFKDPRFSYTLSAWLPCLEKTAFICVFRDPGATVQSILKEAQEEKYLHSLSINKEQALKVWMLMYQHILTVHRHNGKWLFLHFNQMLEENGLNRLKHFTGASIDPHFPDPALRRSRPDPSVPQEALQIYRELCAIAKYNE